jgi:NTE family protein
VLIDGSLLDNLPVAPMAFAGEGPVLAVDVKGGEARPRAEEAGPGGAARELPEKRTLRVPSLPETMRRVALLSSANTTAAARSHADFTIEVRVPGVGLLEFHQIDEARTAGRLAASAALETPPSWLLHERASSSQLSDRRTVIRV